MSLRSPSPNRRAVLASLGAAVPAAVIAAPAAAAVPLAPAADPHLALLPALRQAFVWDRASRPIEPDAAPFGPEELACRAVQKHCWSMAQRVMALPVPKTLAGLGVTALAMSVWAETSIGSLQNDGLDHERYPEERRLASAIRAMMSVAGVESLPDWTGFGDEPDSETAWDAMVERQGEGSLPAWALAGKSGPDDADLATGGVA